VPVLKAALRQLGRAAYFRVGEGDCKCEIAVGQFNIFGATEEKLGQGFPGIFTRQEKSARAVVDTRDRESS